MGFCPICGKDTDTTFCEEHTPNELEHKDVVVRLCECRKYFYRNQWLRFESVKNVAEKIAKDSIKGNARVNAFVDNEVVKKRFEIEVFKGGDKFLIQGKVQVEKCPVCSRIGSNYFEAIIQLRPHDDELVEFVYKQIEKEEHAFISKVVELKEGFDLYVSSNKFALKMGKRLSQSFKGETKISKTLHTRDKMRSKDLYRMTVCFRRQ